MCRRILFFIILLLPSSLCLSALADSSPVVNYKDSIANIKKEIKSLNNRVEKLRNDYVAISEDWDLKYQNLKSDSADVEKNLSLLRQRVSDLNNDLNSPSDLNNRYHKAVHAEHVAAIEDQIDKIDLEAPLLSFNVDSLKSLLASINLEKTPSPKMSAFNKNAVILLNDIDLINQAILLNESRLNAKDVNSVIKKIDSRFNSWSTSRKEEVRPYGVTLSNYLRAWQLLYEFAIKITAQEEKYMAEFPDGLSSHSDQLDLLKNSIAAQFDEFEASKPGVFVSKHPYLGKKFQKFRSEAINNPLAVTPAESDLVDELKEYMP